MSLDLAKMKEFQKNLSEDSGSETNRKYWRMMLADSFPKIIKEQHGEATVIEFMGKRYIKQ